MVKAKVATELSESVWMDYEGNLVLEKEAHGCKVTHNLAYPEMCIVVDKVGGNISQKSDGNKGGEKFICKKGNVPQQKEN